MDIPVVCHWNGDGDIAAAWLDHYRAMGVASVHLILHGSDDENAAILGFAAREPVIVHERYGGRFDEREKVRRLTRVLRGFAGQWALVVDSDEFLELPLSSLEATIARLERDGAGCMAAPLLQRLRRDGSLASPVPVHDVFAEFPLCSERLYWLLGASETGGCLDKYPLLRASADIEVARGNHSPPAGGAPAHPQLRGASHHFKWRSGVASRLRKAVEDGVDWAADEVVPYLRYLADNGPKLPLDGAFAYARREMRRRGLLALGPGEVMPDEAATDAVALKAAGARPVADGANPSSARQELRAQAPARRPHISRADIGFVTTAPFLLATAAMVGERRWPAAARHLRKIQSVGKKAAPQPSRLAGAAARLQMPLEALASAVARSGDGRVENLIQSFRVLLGRPWTPAIELIGRAYLDRALERGRGAVLWVAHFCHASLITKMGLARAGYSLVHISRPEHGVSKSQFGVKVLNRLRADVENRYLAARIVHDRAHPGATAEQASAVLRRNGIVSVTVGAWEGRRIAVCPFLGGEIRVALGAPALARATGAALLPVFTLRTDEGAYRLTIGRPLAATPPDDKIDYFLTAAEALFVAHEPFVRAAPDQWRGWSQLLRGA